MTEEAEEGAGGAGEGVEEKGEVEERESQCDQFPVLRTWLYCQ